MVTDEEVDIADATFSWNACDTRPSRDCLRHLIEAVDAHREALHKAYLQSIRDEIIKDA